MIGIVHGYGLGGAGSNLWTRETVAALCDNGETVHLMCQATDLEDYGFVSELWTYDDKGAATLRFQRPSDRAGRCIAHRPTLDVLPTYVRPDRPSDYVRSILDLDEEDIEAYIARNARTLRHVVAEHGVRAWHVNHVILLSEALRRLQPGGVRFAIMPHGSALEYVVQHDERMRALARRALDAADRVFALNQEIRDRLARYFPDLSLEPKTRTVRVGVDTERFRPLARSERASSVDRLGEALRGVERGHGPEHTAALEAAVDAAAVADDGVHGADADRGDDAGGDGAGHARFRAALEPARDYATGRPDADIEDRLRQVDWTEERIVSFVGRLLPAKGVAALVAAFPLVLEAHPRTRLVLVGAGWLREYLEAFTLALSRGHGELAFRIMTWAAEGRQEGARPSATAFLRRVRESGRWDAYVESARAHLTPDKVVHTGFLEHHLLAHVFPLSDVAVFPSAVAEASPLVVPEAAACGCLPMGTDFAGMRRSLDSLAPRLPEPVRDLLRLDPDPAATADSIARNVRRTLELDFDATDALRAAAVEEYDWHRIARSLAHELHQLTGSPGR